MADRGKALVLGGGVGNGRRVVGRGRGERKDLARLRIDHHDGAAVAAEALDRRLLERG